MGTKITELMQSKQISIDELKNKTIVVDSFNQLYMFLSTIRQRDGALLTDNQGNVTSHLIGLFSRFTRLMHYGMRFIFVFDGEPPELKKKERLRRRDLKIEAQKKFEEAKVKEDVAEMKKYAQRTSMLNKDMIEEAKKLISALGFPVIQAPSEGEAQAAYIVKKGEAYALISQDADSLIFGTPLLVKNLTITGRRKKANKLAYEELSPELISLSENLKNLGIDIEQLIVLAMLTGTDYNLGGIKGIGPKNAYKLVKKYGKDFEGLFNEAKWNDFFDFSWKEVFNLIKETPVTDNYKLEFRELDEEKIIELLVKKHDFSEERIKSALKDLVESKPKEQSLNKWF